MTNDLYVADREGRGPDAAASSVRLGELLLREHIAMADFLVALAEFDAARLWVALGYSSLFHFLHRELGLSKGAAHYRKIAAELVRRFPEVVQPLRDGRLCITSIVELARVLTAENRDEVLPRFFHRSRRDAKELAAELRPAELRPLRTVVTAASTSASDPGRGPVRQVNHVVAWNAESAGPLRSVGSRSVGSLSFEVDFAQVVQPVEPRRGGVGPEPVGAMAVSRPRREGNEVSVSTASHRPASARPDEIDPLDAEQQRLHVTVSRRFLAKLDQARAALSHSSPGATTEQVLEAALDLVISTSATRKGLRTSATGVRLSPTGGVRTSATGGLATSPTADPRTSATGRPQRAQRLDGSGFDAQPSRARAATGLAPKAAAAPAEAMEVSRQPKRRRPHIPAAVRRTVWERDGGCCQWPAARGGICGSTLRAELDHVTPLALDGASTVENLRVLCRFHNRLAARAALGDAVVDAYARRARSSRQPGLFSPGVLPGGG